MARKLGVRSIYDTHNNVALADDEHHGPEDLKEKLSKVREVVPSMSKDQIVMALRCYDYDVNATITAISENGLEETLREWSCAGNKVKMANKIRKRKKKTKKEPAPDFGENVEANAGGDCKNIALGKLDEDKEHLEEHAASTSPEDTFMSSYKHNGSDPEKYPAVSYGWGEDPLPEEPSQEDDDKPEDFGEFETKSSNRPMHNSGRSKSSPDIKRTDGHEANSLPSSTTTIPKKTCLEKSLKDLSRQTVALQRVQVLLEEQLTKAEKAVKAAFSEVHKVLNDRQVLVEEELEKVKNDARFVLEQRQKLAAELKERSDTAPSLSEQSLAELRDDIKHFVVERKYDEELSKTARFVYTKEKIEKEIKNFGQVVHVRDPYTSRRLSLSSIASSNFHDSGYHQSVTSSPVYKNSHDTMKEENRGRRFEGGGGYNRASDGRSPKVYPISSHGTTLASHLVALVQATTLVAAAVVVRMTRAMEGQTVAAAGVDMVVGAGPVITTKVAQVEAAALVRWAVTQPTQAATQLTRAVTQLARAATQLVRAATQLARAATQLTQAATQLTQAATQQTRAATQSRWANRLLNWAATRGIWATLLLMIVHGMTLITFRTLVFFFFVPGARLSYFPTLDAPIFFLILWQRGIVFRHQEVYTCAPTPSFLLPFVSSSSFFFPPLAGAWFSGLCQMTKRHNLSFFVVCALALWEPHQCAVRA
nr:spermatogenesis-associated serine-rich protein 2-like isoform X2 [Rhipicephalus microplus]